MEKLETLKLLEMVKNGEITPQDAAIQLKIKPFDDIGYAKIDYHRSVRQGIAEVIYGEGKSSDHIKGIVKNMLDNGRENILITRISEQAYAELADLPSHEYHKQARVVIVNRKICEKPIGNIVVVSGGTSDFGVCEEAALTAELFGNKVTRLYDVGVAGLHRLLSNLQPLMEAKVVVAVAGMEGALASVVGGLVDCPVVAVPTSVGYGANFKGVSALLSMLNSCASGVSVVNIDNGFGAGYLAAMINKIGEEV